MSGAAAVAARPARAWPAVGGVALSLVLLLAGGCGRSYDQMAVARGEFARQGAGPVFVAVINDPAVPSYLDGLREAVADINANGGVLAGRRLQLKVYPGGETFDAVRATVRRIAADPRIVAVLGHTDPKVAAAAAVVYQAAKILFMPPFSADASLPQYGFEMVLRMVPDSATRAAQSASVAALLGYRRIAILHSRDETSRERAFMFEDAARRIGLDVVFRGSFPLTGDNYRDRIGPLQAINFDALYLSTETASGARILTQMRALRLRQPVMGSERLDDGHLDRVAAAAAEWTLVPTVFDADDPGPSTRRFVTAYTKAYGRGPDEAAALGYDSIRLLAFLVAQAGSTDPQLLSATARYGRPWAGVTGIHDFNHSGSLFGKYYRFQVLQAGRWRSLPAVTVPYLLSTYEAYRRTLGLAAASLADPEWAAQAQSVKDVVSATGATRTAADLSGPPPPDGLEFITAGQPQLSADQRDFRWLSLVHDILKFKRLGVMVPPSDRGRALVPLARRLAERRGFTLDICDLPDAAATAPAPAPAPADNGGEPPPARFEPPSDDALDGLRLGPLEQAALACYSRLAVNIDAMLSIVDDTLDPPLVRYLNRRLRFYRVPVFALAPSLAQDYGLTLALVATGGDLSDPLIAERFAGLLHGIRVPDLIGRLVDLPTVSIDLQALAQLDQDPDPYTLTLISRVLEPAEPSPIPNDVSHHHDRPSPVIPPATLDAAAEQE